MPKRKAGGQKQKNQRKYGRQKRKDIRKGSPISLFARGKITGEQYFKMTDQLRKQRS